MEADAHFTDEAVEAQRREVTRPRLGVLETVQPDVRPEFSLPHLLLVDQYLRWPDSPGAKATKIDQPWLLLALPAWEGRVCTQSSGVLGGTVEGRRNREREPPSSSLWGGGDMAPRPLPMVMDVHRQTGHG